jgi:hypothetical protein
MAQLLQLLFQISIVHFKVVYFDVCLGKLVLQAVVEVHVLLVLLRSVLLRLELVGEFFSCCVFVLELLLQGLDRVFKPVLCFLCVLELLTELGHLLLLLGIIDRGEFGCLDFVG